jgi:hypothetical protein
MGFTRKENRGIDTETYRGYVKLICDDSGRAKEVESIEEIIQFLTHERFRNNFNWFWNIKFDFEAIIKYLDRDELIELYTTKKLERSSFSINYIDKKFFSLINKKRNARFYFYDMYSFIETSLNVASKKYLNDKKMSDVVNASLLNTDLKYWRENKENIIKYCIKDALLTKKVADYFWNLVYTHMNYYPKRPFSKGKISEEYFLAKCYIPTINDIPKLALEYAYNSYLGGRFELIQKGKFEKCITYDIKSAYPKGISELIDYSKGKWKMCKNNKINPSAYSGYYECRISAMELQFSPFTKKIHELSIYPNGHFKQYLSKDDILFFRENFENVEINILSGVEFFPTEILTPFRDEILKLYQWKETEKDEGVKYAVKIFMNAFYGKTIQKTGEKNLIGKIFNPIWATEITSKTRRKLFSLMLQNPDAVIGTSTDSVHSTEALKIPKSPALGEFSKDFEGQGVYIMSDVYYLWNEDTKKYKNKIRGFALAKTKDLHEEEEEKIKSLRNILESMTGSNEVLYEYYSHRPYHLGECLLHKYKKDLKGNKIPTGVFDLNIFGDVKKSIKINGDKKRVWDSEFKNGRDCLKRNIQSLPLVVS